MNASLADLLRELRDRQAHISYYNRPGTVEGCPVIWRQRFVECQGEHGWASFIYENWPPTGTYQIRAYAHGFSIDPITSVDELWQVWEELKAAMDTPAAPIERPDRVGQLDIFDLIGAS